VEVQEIKAYTLGMSWTWLFSAIRKGWTDSTVTFSENGWHRFYFGKM